MVLMANNNQTILFSALILVCICMALISLLGGRTWIPFDQALLSLHSGLVHMDSRYTLYSDLILSMRLPRTILVMMVGATLSGSGVALQSVYRNPLISPYILGISSGAALGASISLLLTGNLYITSMAAFVGGITITILTWGIDRYTTVLAGMALGTLCGSLIALVKWIADPFTVMPFITFWILGTFSRATGSDLLMAFPFLLSGLFLLYLLRWQFNILSFGEETAIMLGVHTRLVRGIIITATTLIVSVSVSLCGVIGWVGLVVPHACRMIVGNDHTILLPVSMLSGAVYLLMVDILIRTVIPGEMPIGILTGIIGAPLFILLVWRVRTV